MNSNNYEIRKVKGARLITNDDQARIVGEELLRIELLEGELTPAIVIRHATDGGPLTEFFEWSDHTAAESWRLHQARQLLGSVEIRKIDEPEKTTRLFVNIVRANADNDGEEDGRRSYVNTRRALTDPDMRDIVLQRALHDLEAIKRKYSNLHELASVWKALEGVKDYSTPQVVTATA